MPQKYPHLPFQNLDKLCHQLFSHPDVFNVLAERVRSLVRHSAGHFSAVGVDGNQFPVTFPGQAVMEELDKTVHSLLREASTALPASVQDQRGEHRSVALLFRDASLVVHAIGHPTCPDFQWYVSDQDALVAEGKLSQANVLSHFDGRDFPRMKALTQPLKAGPYQEPSNLGNSLPA